MIVDKLFNILCQSQLKPHSHQAYDHVTTYMRPKNGPIVERTYDWSQRSYDWSQRSWVIAMGKSVATRSMVMFQTGRATLRPVAPPIDCSRIIPRLIVRSIFGGHDCSYDRSFMASTSRTISNVMLDIVIDLLQSVLIARPRIRPIVR